MKSQSYKDLLVWQKSIDLCELIYRVCSGFPSDELYGLTSQMKRSVISISSNIAEGQARRYSNEFHRFLLIANGSLAELDTQCFIAKRLGFIAEDICRNLEDKITEIQKMLYALIESLKTKN